MWLRRVPGKLPRPLLVIGLFIAALGLPERVLAAQSACTFRYRFQARQALIPDTVGDCIDSEQIDSATGHAEQRATRGLVVWRQSTNSVAFIDDTTTWFIGPDGLVAGPNSGSPHRWEGQAQGTATPEPTTPASGVGGSSAGDLESQLQAAVALPPIEKDATRGPETYSGGHAG
jgi:hypothetical protein